MKVQKIKYNEGKYGWLVLDDQLLPIKPVTEYLRYLDHINKSPNTLKSYARHLKLYFEYLSLSNKKWKDLNLSILANFVGWLSDKFSGTTVINVLNKQTSRKANTVNSILGCIYSFYRYHNLIGTTSVKLTESKKVAGGRYKALLHHIYKNKPVQARLVSIKHHEEPPKVISHNQFETIVSLCTNYRDRLLLWLLYETGLRIGQALALRHEDIICWDKVIHVRYRFNNINQVRNKTLNTNTIHTSDNLMLIYTDYVNSLDQSKLNDYVFVNLIDYTPLKYYAVRKLFNTLSVKSGIHIRPHILRHSHANNLLKAGWDMSFIQKRLGHSSVQTTIDIYTHIDNESLRDAFNGYLAKTYKEAR